MSPHLVALAQASGVIVAGSCAGVLAKQALADVPPFTFVWLQIAIGGILLTAYTFGLRGERLPRRLPGSVWAYIVWIGIANFTLVRVLFVLALARLPATTHAYLVNFVGVVTMAMSVFVLRERPAAVQVVGAVVALLGLRVFFREIPPPTEIVGVVYVAVGVLGLASTNNVTRKLALVTDGRLSNTVLSTVALWIGGLPVVLFGLATDWPPPVHGWTNWSIIALNGAVSITIGLTVWNFILRTLRSYEASVLAATSVIWTALLAVPLLGERLEAHQLGGIALMLVGLALVQIRTGLGLRRSDLDRA